MNENDVSDEVFRTPSMELRSGKKWFEQEAESSKNKTPSRRTSLFDVFQFRHHSMSAADAKKNASRRSDVLKRSVTAVDEEVSQFATPLRFSTLGKSPAKKAKRILGIESPIPKWSTKKPRRSTAQGDASSSTGIAPLADSHECDEVTNGVRTDQMSAELSILSGDSSSYQTPEDTPEFPYSKVKSPSAHSSRQSPLLLFGRSLSSSIRLKCTPHSAFERSVTSHMQSVDEEQQAHTSLLSRDIRGGDTPTSRPLRSSKRVIERDHQSKLTKVKSVLMNRFASAPRAKPVRTLHRSKSVKRRKPRPNEDEVAAEQKRENEKARARLHAFKKAVEVLGNGIELDCANECIYDAIACDISSEGMPLSKTADVVLKRVGEKVREEMNNELKRDKKVFILNSGPLPACKYVIFVVGEEANVNDSKTWQQVRFAYFNLINEAVKHQNIHSLLVPYLFTEESSLDQNKVVDTAISAVLFVLMQGGFNRLSKLAIGGSKREDELRELYQKQLSLTQRNMVDEDAVDGQGDTSDTQSDDASTVTASSSQSTVTDLHL